MKVYLNSGRAALVQAECTEFLKTMPDGSVDAIVTDPPYGLSFMGKAWDYDVPQAALWREVLRVLKPGGHMVAFFGSRTYHRGVVQIEDAGFEVRDSLMWLYGTGFPKSLNLPGGVGTALKPAHEPIVLARKPLNGTVASNVQAHGTGALNIDGCRVGTEGATKRSGQADYPKNPDGTEDRSQGWARTGHEIVELNKGRWPANVLLDEEAAAALDVQSGTLKTRGNKGQSMGVSKGDTALQNSAVRFSGAEYNHGGEGGASRFFYCAKASRAERDRGCEALPAKSGGEATDREDGSAGVDNPRAGAGRTGGARNHHPTVKPVALMRWLVRLITPPGGTVLDPFTGSGTTGIAALEEGFNFIGVEMSEEYAAIAKARLEHADSKSTQEAA